MFKTLVLKSLYNLADERIEEHIRDRISFQDFLGLHRGNTIPDAKTIWLFAEQLKNLGLECLLFDRFNELLDASGFNVKSGYIVDGSFVDVPKQRNTKDENEQIKKGEIPETLSANPHVLAQKDCDARWAKKGDETHFGYKNHSVVDDAYKFVRGYDVTDAAVHDSSLPGGACFWSDEESLSGRGVAEYWNGASEVLDGNAKFGVQHGSFGEFEASEKGAEIGVTALRVRAGGVIFCRKGLTYAPPCSTMAVIRGPLKIRAKQILPKTGYANPR